MVGTGRFELPTCGRVPAPTQGFYSGRIRFPLLRESLGCFVGRLQEFSYQ